MSAVHSLSLNIPETSVETTLVIQDHSVYSGASVAERQLEIWVPGFPDSVVILEEGIPLGFNINMTAVTLGIQNPDSSIPSILPDGLYRIKYSVFSTGDQVEYYHMRTSRLLNIYNRELCKIHFQECEPSKEEKETLDKLRLIRMYMDGAKAKAEYCHAPNQGLQILAYAEKMLMKFVFKGCAGGDCQPCSNCSPCKSC
jgi:hypothetical protein